MWLRYILSGAATVGEWFRSRVYSARNDENGRRWYKTHVCHLIEEDGMYQQFGAVRPATMHLSSLDLVSIGSGQIQCITNPHPQSYPHRFKNRTGHRAIVHPLWSCVTGSWSPVVACSCSFTRYWLHNLPHFGHAAFWHCDGFCYCPC